MPPKPICCWTCKLRHVKCDAASPACVQCTSRRIHCHGYGPKPGWMDGGAREQEERQRIKSKVKKSFRQRRSLGKKSTGRLGPNIPRDASRQNTPSTPSSPRSVHSGETETQQDILDLGHISARVGNESAPDHLPLSAVFARPFPYEESSLLMHYLDHVFPMQYFYYSKTAGSRGWLLWLLSKNGPLYRASLSLAALDLHFPHNREEYNAGIAYHSGTLTELQDFISSFQEDGGGADDERLVEVIACGAALISFEVLRGSSNNWQQHLHATASILACMRNDEDSFPASRSMPWATGPSATLSFHIPVLLWIDILSCISTREKPRLPYQQWMSPGSDVKLESVMGCQNWAMKAIGDIACLYEWKVTSVAAGSLDMEEYDCRRRRIEEELESGLEALQISSMQSSFQAKVNCTTHIFATAALVQLQILGADVSDSWSPSFLRRAVMRVIGVIHSASEPPSARQIIWPICVAASVADADLRSFFEQLVTAVLSEVNGMVGNCKAVLEIIQECWRLRDLEPNAHWECSSVMMKMGVTILLI